MVFFVVEYDTFPPTIKKTLQQGMQVKERTVFFSGIYVPICFFPKNILNSIVNVILDLVAGGWSAWGAYSACVPIVPPAGANMPCVGSKSRKRICNNPPPKNGGPPCPGSAIEYDLCDCIGKPQLRLK